MTKVIANISILVLLLALTAMPYTAVSAGSPDGGFSAAETRRLWMPFTAVSAGSPTGPVTAYPLPGSPDRVAVAGIGSVWFTLPVQNAIGHLELTSSGTYGIHTYTLPTAASQPHDIAYAAGSVWVTEHTGNKIARFNPAAASGLEWTEYQIPTSAGKPTGLTVLAGNPIQVWFCEQAANKLGLLTISAAGTSQFTEFPLPTAWSGANMENIAATSSNNVWFTVPGRKGIVQFSLADWQRDPATGFGFVSTTTPGIPMLTSPYDIKIDGGGIPWITEPLSNRIGRLNPQTMVSFEWYPVPTSNSGLAGLDLAMGYTWFAARESNRMGRLLKVGYVGSTIEQRLPGSDPAPSDIGVAPDGCAWVAAGGTNTLVSWCPPYISQSISQIYLPITRRN